MIFVFLLQFLFPPFILQSPQLKSVFSVFLSSFFSQHLIYLSASLLSIVPYCLFPPFPSISLSFSLHFPLLFPPFPSPFPSISLSFSLFPFSLPYKSLLLLLLIFFITQKSASNEAAKMTATLSLAN